MNKKSIISAILSLLIFTSTVIPISATTPKSTSEETKQTTEDDTKKSDNSEDEKKESQDPCPHAPSAILLDMKSNKVLYEKNSKSKVYPASTTKMMTAILTLENCEDLDKVITATKEAIEPITNKHSHMGILIGEELTIRQLLYGMLVYSANDAANCLAVEVSGSISEFAKLMNEKAKKLGCKGTNFTNPHGFHDANHYTTANDLAIIARYAMKNETFKEIVKTSSYTIQPTNKYKEVRNLTSTNYLISNKRRGDYFYKKAIGIKTGFTDEAGSCLVAAAVDGDTELLSVVMNCKNTTEYFSFSDTINLFEYGFKNFKYLTIIPKGEVVSDSAVYDARKSVRVALGPKKDIASTLPVDVKIEDIEIKTDIPDKIKAPIKKGDKIGSVKCIYKGEEVGKGELVAQNDVKKDYIIAFINLIKKIIFNPISLILIALIILLKINSNIKKKKKRQRRRQKLSRVDSNYEHIPKRELERRNSRRNSHHTSSTDYASRYSHDRFSQRRPSDNIPKKPYENHRARNYRNDK